MAEPGIGKSTLGFANTSTVLSSRKKVLYVTAEESEKQLMLRSKRLRTRDSLLVYAQTSIAAIEVIKTKSLNQNILILFRLFTMKILERLEQCHKYDTVRRSLFVIKENNLTGMIIGHITKDGSIAGPKVLEHLVDVILYFEGERHLNYRLLRCLKIVLLVLMKLVYL